MNDYTRHRRRTQTPTQTHTQEEEKSRLEPKWKIIWARAVEQ